MCQLCAAGRVVPLCHDDREKRTLLWRHFEPMMRDLALRYTRLAKQRSAGEFEDLLNETAIAFDRAVKQYGPELERASKFSTYLHNGVNWWLYMIVNTGGIIRLSEHNRRAAEAYKMGEWNGDMTEILAAAITASRVETWPGMDFGRSADRHYEQDLSEAVEILADKLLELEPRDREILTRRFGVGREAETLEAVGDWCGVTKERVRQLQQQALKRLKKLMPDVRLGTERVGRLLFCDVGDCS